MKKISMRLLAVSLLFCLPVIGFGQSFMNPNAWKKYRHEIMFGMGASNFLGDLGGRDQVGSDFLWDLEFPKTKFGQQIAWIYHTTASTGIRTTFRHGILAGDDALTLEPFRHNRNLNFKSRVYELSVVFQWYFLKEKGGNRYNLKNKKGRKIGAQANSIGSYLFAGIGGCYFNPKGNYGGVWVDLKPLRTEGQGLPGGPDEYSNFTLAFPVGIGFKKALNLNWSLTLEFSHSFTLTDYIDDVSGFYYDPTEIYNFHNGGQTGTQAAYLSNPTNNTLDYYIDPTAPGYQRGDPDDRDGYLFAIFSANYKFKNKTGGYGRIKRKRVRASF